MVLAFFCLTLFGCATPRLKSTLKTQEGSELVNLREIAKEYELKCNYLPFSENVFVENQTVRIQLRPGYKYIVINNKLQKLKDDVLYKQGSLYVPAQLSALIRGFSIDKNRVSNYFLEPSGKVKTIVVDPGHGGRDPGAVSPWGLKEKEVNLGIALYLKEFLEDRGFRVYLTRGDDRFVSLNERVRFSRENKADLFISIHANAYRLTKIRGFEVYYLSSKFSNEQSKILAISENLCEKQGLDLSEQLKLSLGEILNGRNRRLTMDLASSIMETADTMGIYTRKIIGAPFYVLKYNICPSVLIEAGYMTNRKDEQLLRTPLYRKQVALSIAEGVYDSGAFFNKRQVLNR